MTPSSFTAFAKAQAFGLIVGFALALWATLATGVGLRIFLMVTVLAWIGWEMRFGRHAPSKRTDMGALSYGLFSGFAFPWIGFVLAALAAWAMP
jgi:hypothetical protein